MQPLRLLAGHSDMQCRCPLIATGLIILLAIPFGARAGADVLAELAQRDWSDSAGLVYAVSHRGETVRVGTHGLASLELAVPLTPESVLNAGSIAKTFTAHALLRLQAEGVLSLDDEIHRYVPELPDYGAPVTLRQLLQHTAGLKDYWALSSLAGMHSGDARTQQAALALVRRQPDLNFAPGTRYIYSNTGYLLAAEVVSRVTGYPFADWMHLHVFEPLHMAHSRILDDAFAVVPGLAPSYRTSPVDRQIRREPLNSGVVGSGNLVTTVSDLLRWADYLMGAEIDGQPVLSLMSEQPDLPDLPPPGYGLGISIGMLRGLPVFHHGGANAGYRSHLLMMPSAQLAVAVMANAGQLRVSRVAEALAEAILVDENVVPPQPTAPHDETISAAFDDQAYAGLYQLDTGALLRVRQVEGQLVALLMGAVHTLRPVGGHDFALEGQQARLRFQPDRDGQVGRLKFELPEGTLSGERQEPVRLRGRDLREYAGEYLAPSLGVIYLVAERDGALGIGRPGGDDLLLSPLRRDLFVHWDTADFIVQFSRDRRDRVRGFTVSVDRARQVGFERR